MDILAELPVKASLRKSMMCYDTRKVNGFCVANLKTFAVHGCKCVRCGRVGNRLIAWKDKGGGTHVDLFSETPKGDLILMNRDHIIPKSKKGPNTGWNYQTMCIRCNCKKGNQETAADRNLAQFRNHWKNIHVSIHNNCWKYIPKFLRKTVVNKMVVVVRDLYLYKITYVLAKVTA